MNNTEKTQEITCPICQKSNPPGEWWCQHCDSSLDDDDEALYEAQEEAALAALTELLAPIRPEQEAAAEYIGKLLFGDRK